MGTKLEQIKFSEQKQINVNGGDIFHIMKISNNKNFVFREAYFSFVEKGFIKGWKKHSKMSSNLTVPIGEVEFTFVTDDFQNYKKFILGEKNYGLLSIPPGIWFSFKGIDEGKNIILNLSNFEHDSSEVEKINLEDFPLKIKL